MTAPVKRLPIVDLRRDGGTQVRAEMKAETVDEYAEALGEGAEFPPVVTFHDGEVYWLADGFHRVLAHEKSGLVDVLAEIRTGSKRDALLFAVGANATHGLARTNKDKRRAVEILLRDEEWARKSDGEVAQQAAVSQPFASKVRRELATQNGFESPERTGKDGRTINTAGIGKAKPAAPQQLALGVEDETPAPAAALSLDEWHEAYAILLRAKEEDRQAALKSLFSLIDGESREKWIADVTARANAQVLRDLKKLIEIAPTIPEDRRAEFDSDMRAFCTEWIGRLNR